MRIALKLLLWPIFFWTKPTRVFLRIVDQAVGLGAPASHLLTEWRYFGRWRASLRPGATPVETHRPWMTFRAIERLEASVKRGDKVFEYGGGGSTLFFLGRGAEVTTIEHDQGWFDVLGQKIGADRAWAGRLIRPERRSSSAPCDPADPALFGTSDEALKDFDFRAYVQAIQSHPDGQFDVVCVDGRSRPACLALARSKVKRGGLLVLDNAERETYARAVALCADGFEVLLAAPGSVPSCRWPSQTLIWRKS